MACLAPAVAIAENVGRAMAIIVAVVPMAYTILATDRTVVYRGLGVSAALTFGCAVLFLDVHAVIGVG